MNASGLTSTFRDADAHGFERMIAVRPVLSGIERAGLALGLGRRELLHAGPRLTDVRNPCLPMLNGAVAAVLFEGWAQDADEARNLVRNGTVTLRPAQDAGCVVPLADVLSPSMWVQKITDASGRVPASFTPLNGGGQDVQRVGVLNEAVVARLRWLGQALGPAIGRALAEPLPLLEAADRGLAAGDDLHGRTAAATAQFAAALVPRLSGSDASLARQFLDDAPGFFLNLWMASSRCILSAASGIPGCSLVTAAAGNGQHFGIQLAASPGRWTTCVAHPPRLPPELAEHTDRSLGAIGDSAIVDMLGFGAMTTVSGRLRQRPGFASLWPEDAAVPESLLMSAHPGMPLSRPRIGVSAAVAAEMAKPAFISLGVLDRDGQSGRLGGGFYRVPSSLFEEAWRAAG